MKITMWYLTGNREREKDIEINDVELAGMDGQAKRRHIMQKYVRPWVSTNFRCGYTERGADND